MVNKYTLFTIVSLMFFLNGCVIKNPSSNQKFIYLERVFKINSTAAAIRPISKNAQLDSCNHSLDFDISNMGGNGKFKVFASSEFSEILDKMPSIKAVKWTNGYGKSMLSICLPEKVLYVETYRVELFGVIMDINSKKIKELNKKLSQIVLVRDIINNNISVHKNKNSYSEYSNAADNHHLDTSKIMSNGSNYPINKKVTKKKLKKKLRKKNKLKKKLRKKNKLKKKLRKKNKLKKKFRKKNKLKKKFRKKKKLKKKFRKKGSKSNIKEHTRRPLVKALVGKALDLKKRVSVNKKFRKRDIIKIYVSIEGGNSRYSSKKSSGGKFAFYGLRKSAKGSVPVYECKFRNGAYIYSINKKYAQTYCSLDTSPKIVFYELPRYMKKYEEVVQYFKGGDTNKIKFFYRYRKNALPLEKGVTTLEAWRAPK